MGLNAGSSPAYNEFDHIKTYYLPDRKSRGKLQETEGSNPWDW
jgi:hypothetical protein